VPGSGEALGNNWAVLVDPNSRLLIRWKENSCPSAPIYNDTFAIFYKRQAEVS